jgi:hypothetical protein
MICVWGTASVFGRGRFGIVWCAFFPLGGSEPSATIIPLEEREQVIEQLSAGRRRRDHQQRRHRCHVRSNQDDGGKQPHNYATGHSTSPVINHKLHGFLAGSTPASIRRLQPNVQHHPFCLTQAIDIIYSFSPDSTARGFGGTRRYSGDTGAVACR